MDDAGERFADALAAKDAERLRGLLAPDVDFAGLTPGRSWSGRGPDEVLRTLLGEWFEPHDEIVGRAATKRATVGDRERVSYRLALRCAGAPRVTEQHAFYQLDPEGRIDWLRIMCSGFRPEQPPQS